MPVLGLAGCHWRKLDLTKVQIRRDDQSRYPPNSWVASLAVDSWVGHCPLRNLEVLHPFRWFTCPAAAGLFKAPTNEMKVKMKGKWKWDDDGNEMTATQPGHETGNPKEERKKENTNTNTPSPERANPERAREKKKRRDGPNTDQGGGGQKRLTQPTRREPKPISAREGRKPDLEREHAWDRGPMGN